MWKTVFKETNNIPTIYIFTYTYTSMYLMYISYGKVPKHEKEAIKKTSSKLKF